MAQLSSIQLTKKTRDELSKLGVHRETYEDIILRLIRTYKEREKSKEVGG